MNLKYPAFALAGVALAAVFAAAQAPNGPLHFTAVTDNVSGSKVAVRIDLVRFSTDAERDELLNAWNMTPAAGRGGRGGGRAGRGAGRGASAGDVAPDPAAVDSSDPFGTFRGGNNGNNAAGGRLSNAPRPTAEGTLATALAKTPTLGYIWASEVAGYAIHGAVHVPTADGGERIILITDRRLGATNDLWKPAGAAGPEYPFSVIELRVNSKGEGEGKISLTGKVAADGAAKIVALEDYAASPVILRGVKRGASK